MAPLRRKEPDHLLWDPDTPSFQEVSAQNFEKHVTRNHMKVQERVFAHVLSYGTGLLEPSAW